MILDEALVALDVTTREEVIRGLKYTAATQRTCLVVITHNIADAFSVGQRCVVVGGRPVRIIADVDTVRSGGGAAGKVENVVMEAIRQGHL